MTARLPLVLQDDNSVGELPTGDHVIGFGVFEAITESDYNELDPSEQNDPTRLYVFVESAAGLFPTRTWLEISWEDFEELDPPDPTVLYVLYDDSEEVANDADPE